mmetsp:Transcript_33727/g.53626  ORF Transcript_33727/g.53626 Transcript_33727/m.53626 type:complete len:383 (-) Transcript_33727:59-1207(-)
MAPVPQLGISGTSLLPGETTQDPSYATSQSFAKPSNCAGLDSATRLHPRGRATPTVCGANTAQRAQGRLQRRGWYHPARVPDAKTFSHDRSTCPWRWKNLCETNEKGSSGSMTLANKLRPCAKLAKQDHGRLSTVAAEATRGAHGLLSKPEQDVLDANVSTTASLMRRPASAPCLRRLETTESSLAPGMAPAWQRLSQSANVEAMEWSHTASAPQLARPKSAPSTRSTSSSAPRSASKRPQSAGNQRSGGQPYYNVENLETLVNPVLHRPMKVLLSGDIKTLEDKGANSRTTISQSAHVSPSIPAAHSSALRVGTILEEHRKARQHHDLRQWTRESRGPAFQEEIRAWEERLSLRGRGVPRESAKDFDQRLQVLETGLMLER